MKYEKPVFVDHGLDRVSDFKTSSIWKEDFVDASFSFINFDYPMWHVHKDFCEILFVYGGEVTNYVNDSQQLMKEGDCCIVRKSDCHKISFDGDATRGFGAINFLVRDSYFEQLKYIFGKNEATLFDNADEMMTFHLDEVDRMSVYNQTLLMQTPDNEYNCKNEFACKRIIIGLLAEYVGQRLDLHSEQNVPAWLKKMLSEMQNRENIDKSPVFFVERAPYSYSYVAKEFKKHMGCSIINYLTSVKLNYAKELLQSTDMTTMEISSRLGIDSLSHFNHSFKKHFGQTPSEVRKNR